MPLVGVNVAKPSVTLPPGSRLGLPGALIFVIGIGMVYVALRGWDAKYGLLGGRLAGTGIRRGTRTGESLPPADSISIPVPSSTSGSTGGSSGTAA